MPQRKTTLLALILIPAALAMIIAWFRMNKLRDDAERAHSNLAASQHIIKEIREWKSSPGRAAPITADTPELTRRLREAATAAGLAETPGIEPESPKPLSNSDYSEMALDLRFESLTLRQLTIYLHHLAQILPSARARNIELSPPDQTDSANRQPGQELWRADVAVAYLIYTPRKPTK